MTKLGMKSLLLGAAGLGLGLVLAANGAANAGGFALREQSAYGQGSSFAGIAAGGALSAMFWNPSVMTQFAGKTVEMSASAFLPYGKHFNAAGTEVVNNSGEAAVVPSTYASMQLNDRLWVGMSVNAAYGLGVNFPPVWGGAGTAYAQDTNLATYNFAPSVAYKLTDWLSVSLGLQAQYMWVNFQNARPALAGGGNFTLNSTGWGWGWTAGVTVTPTATTTIGIGYRSAINNKVNGDLTNGVGALIPTGPISTTVNLPDTLTIGLRQDIGDRFTLLAGYEWTNWSRIGTAQVRMANGANLPLPFDYKDGHFYSFGGEYKIDPAWTIRAGIGYEKSPISDVERTPRLPESDRIWYSAGFSWKPPQFAGLSLDVGYSYLDFKNAPINVGPGNPWFTGAAPAYIGSADSHIHIISVGARYQWDAAPARVKQAFLK